MEVPNNCGKPPTRRSCAEEKAAVAAMARTWRKEVGTNVGAVTRVADHRGYGAESVRTWVWVGQADIGDGARSRGECR